MKAIVDSYLQGGHKLVIEDDTLWKYPAHQYKNMYTSYASIATNVEFHSVYEFELDLIFPLFSNIDQLTLRNTKINYWKKEYPCSMRTLNLIKTQISSNWLDYVKNVDCLYLNGNEYFSYPYELPQLTSLSVIGQNIYSSNLQCPRIKRLVLEKCWYGLSYDKVKELNKLEHLKVLKTAGLKQKAEIEALGLKSADVNYIEIPVETNLILQLLNDDCLNFLGKFLNDEDLLTLHKVHPRFNCVRIKKLEVNGESLKRIPFLDNRLFYERLAPFVTKLNIYVTDLVSFEEMMPLFTNLADLSLDFYNLSPCEAISAEIGQFVPAGIVKMYIRGFINNCSNNMTNMFRRLSPSLEILEIEYEYCDKEENEVIKLKPHGLKELRKIKDLSCYFLNLNSDFLDFLRINKNTMERLEIHFERNDGFYPDFWNIISQMPNLKMCNIQRYHESIPRIPRNSFPQLQNLHIDDFYDNYENPLIDFVISLNGSYLKSFRFKGDLFDFGSTISEKISNIEELSLICGYKTWCNLIPAIFVLKKLKRVHVEPLSNDDVLPLIAGLPDLVELKTKKALEPINIMKMRDYLKKVDRKLSFNDVNFG